DPDALRQSIGQSLRPQPNGTWAWKHDRRRVDAGYFDARIQEAHSLIDCCPSIRCPTLMIRGGDSDGCPPEDASRFAALVADGRLVIVDDAGHNVHRDNPSEFVAALRPFLDEHQSMPVTHESQTID